MGKCKTTKPYGFFGSWLFNEIVSREWSWSEAHSNVGICVPTLRRHIQGKIKPTRSVLHVYSDVFNAEYRLLEMYVIQDYGDDNYIANGRFGKWLSEQIKCKGLSLRDLDDITKWNACYIIRHLNGTHIPSSETVMGYCEALGIKDYGTPLSLAQEDRLSKGRD